jgi:hypothetical protein
LLLFSFRSTALGIELCVVLTDPLILVSHCKKNFSLVWTSIHQHRRKLTVEGTRRDVNGEVAGAFQEAAFSRLIQIVTWEEFDSVPGTVRGTGAINATLFAGVWNDGLRESTAEGNEAQEQAAKQNGFHLSERKSQTKRVT